MTRTTGSKTSLPKLCAMALLVFGTAAPMQISFAQSPSSAEAKAAAMVEILKEQKDKQDRAQIERAKNEIRSAQDSSTDTSFLKEDKTQIVLFAIFLGGLFWFVLGQHLLKIGRMQILKRRLERMNDAERKRFFENNPHL